MREDWGSFDLAGCVVEEAGVDKKQSLQAGAKDEACNLAKYSRTLSGVSAVRAEGGRG